MLFLCRLFDGLVEFWVCIVLVKYLDVLSFYVIFAVVKLQLLVYYYHYDI